jgi:type II secretory pathway pseudopilin PulG
VGGSAAVIAPQAQPHQQKQQLNQQQQLQMTHHTAQAAALSKPPYGRIAIPSRHISQRPVIKMSVDLIKTYKTINDKYYADKRRRETLQRMQHQ